MNFDSDFVGAKKFNAVEFYSIALSLMKKIHKILKLKMKNIPSKYYYYSIER